MKIRILAGARADLERQFRYLQRNHTGDETLDKLVFQVEEAVDRIGRSPQTWSLVPGSRQVRRMQILKFRIQVFYKIRSDGTPVIIEFAGPGLQPRWPDRV